MDRADRAGLTLAIIGHVVLFGALALSLAPKPTDSFKPKPISVSFVPDTAVALQAAAPQAVTPPAKSEAPEQGPPEEAAPPEPAPAPVEAPAPAPPAPPKPEPEAAPPPKPADIAPKKPKPVAPPKPVHEKVAAHPAEAPRKPAAEPAKPAEPAPKAKPAKPAEPAPKAKPAPAKSSGTTAAATKPKPRGSLLGPDLLKGLSDQDTHSQSEAPQAAKVDARALQGIQDAIRRQIQPCADKQVDPGPGANKIEIKLNLRLNRDGTLASAPTMVGSNGVDDENSRYVQRVRDLGIAAFKGCSPLKLPAEYYQTANGGWSNINYSWKLR